jgi:23S rRNA (uracil1939-C5)-methyltransferase
MQLKKGDLVEVEIIDLAFGGEGVGRVSTDAGDFVLFVEGVVPGDQVEVKIFGMKKRMAKAFVTKFSKFSELRIQPRCPHFGTLINKDGTVGDPFDCGRNCGGCSWQFLEQAEQLKVKSKIVGDALKRLGGFPVELVEKVLLPVKGMTDPWFYRNKMEFSFEHDKDGKLGLGLHLKGRHHDLTKIENCFLFRPWVGQFLIAVRPFFEQLKFDGQLKSLILRSGVNTGEVMINLLLENGEINFAEKFKNLLLEIFGKLQTDSDRLISIYLTQYINIKGKPKKINENLLWGALTFKEKLILNSGRELVFNVAPQAFLQPNTKQAEVLYSIVDEFAGLHGNESVFDLYCGTGTIGIMLAKDAAFVTGIELLESAVSNAKINAGENAVTNIDFLAGDVNAVLPGIKRSIDLVVVDPPRAGLTEDVIKTIVDSKVGRMIYVSCNPATMSRDLKLLVEGGFKLIKVQPVDQFCQTYHVESVCLLEK